MWILQLLVNSFCYRCLTLNYLWVPQALTYGRINDVSRRPSFWKMSVLKDTSFSECLDDSS